MPGKKPNKDAGHDFFKRKPPTVFTFLKFTSDVYNIFHIGLSQQHKLESTIFEDTRRISHTMIINYPRNPIRRKQLEIMETGEDLEEESLIEDIVCNVLYLIIGVIYVSFRIQSGAIMFLGVYTLQLILTSFRIRLSKIPTL